MGRSYVAPSSGAHRDPEHRTPAGRTPKHDRLERGLISKSAQDGKMFSRALIAVTQQKPITPRKNKSCPNDKTSVRVDRQLPPGSDSEGSVNQEGVRTGERSRTRRWRKRRRSSSRSSTDSDSSSASLSPAKRKRTESSSNSSDSTTSDYRDSRRTLNRH